MWESAQEKYNNTLNNLQSDLLKYKQHLEQTERKNTLYQKQKNLALTAYQLIIQEFVTA